MAKKTICSKTVYTGSDLVEFIHKNGLLFEMNRLVFHPRGLCLSLTVDPKTKRYAIYDLVDMKDADPEGYVFGKDDFDKARAKLTRFESSKKRIKNEAARYKMLSQQQLSTENDLLYLVQSKGV